MKKRFVDCEFCNNFQVGDWCYVFGDDVFVQIDEILYDTNNKINKISANSESDGCFVNESLIWICRKNENYEDIFLSLNPDDFNIRKLKVKKYS